MQAKEFMIPEVQKLSDPLNHFLVALLLILIIFAVIAIWIFAKWLTAGPWFKRKFNKLFKKKETGNDGVELVKGEVVVDNQYLISIDEKIKNAETPQELLELQLLKENHLKEKERLEKEIAEKEAEKLAKLQQKEDKSRIKAEMKEKEREFKAKEKERKAKAKEEGK